MGFKGAEVMFSYKKTKRSFPELESQRSYDTEEIYNQLISDSFYKCYLCGEYQGNFRSERVEHFIPYEDGKYRNLKFDWNNILLSCDHCNGRKSSIYNKIGADKDILNPIEDKIEIEIIQFYDSKELNDIKIGIEILKENSKSQTTKELLEKIYNGDFDSKNSFAVKNKSRTLKTNISNEIFNFRKLVEKLSLNRGNDYEVKIIAENLKSSLSKKSNFYEFKLGYIEKNESIKKFLIEYGIL